MSEVDWLPALFFLMLTIAIIITYYINQICLLLRTLVHLQTIIVQYYKQKEQVDNKFATELRATLLDINEDHKSIKSPNIASSISDTSD